MYTDNITTRRAKTAVSPSRRALLLGAPSVIFAHLCGLIGPARAEEGKIIVVTSFPEELTTRYEQEFEKKFPGVHVQYVWKQSRDALAELSKPDQGGADIYWAPSLGNFPILRDRGAFRKLSVDRAALPGRLGDERLSDPAGTYEAYDIAGYGVVVNPALLDARGLSRPKNWRDLASPAVADQLAMPIPSKVGFAPALYDIILQSEGWERGWALLGEMSGNAELLASGAGPTTSVREGRLPLALSIDFFALSAQANGLPVEFVYPARTAFLPAHIAITASTRNVDLAKAFVDFALSRDGQRLMMETDSSRHPARPDAYQNKPANIVDPFALGKDAIFAYDSEIGRRRPGLVSLLFDIALTERRAQVKDLWRAIHAAEAKLAASPDAEASRRVAEARRLAGFVPVAASEADDPKALEVYANRDAIDPALIGKWRAALDESRAAALALVGRAP